MVRAAVVAFVLLAGLVMVGAVEAATAGGAEDQDGPRSSVLKTVVEEGRPIPVAVAVEAPRKLSKNSKASNDDAGLSKEVESLLRLLVLKTAVDLHRFFMQPARSLVEDETAAAREKNASGGRELLRGTYKEYDCDGCLAFFEGAPQYTTEEQTTFCSQVSDAIDLNTFAMRVHERYSWHFPEGEKLGLKSIYRTLINTACVQLFQCASGPVSWGNIDTRESGIFRITVRTCCQSLGGACRN